jgi:hypothetical protein
MNGHRAAGKVGAYGRVHLGAHLRQRLCWQHRISVLLEIPPDRFALLLQVSGGLGQEHDALHGGLRCRHSGAGVALHLRPLDEVEHVADVMGQIVELDPEIPLRVRAEDLVELQDPAALRVDSEELVAEETPQLGRLQLEWNRRLQHLEDPGPVLEVPLFLHTDGSEELAQLAFRPFGADISRGDHRHEQGGLLQPLGQDVGKDIVAVQLGVAPDVRRLPQELAHPDLERTMQIRNPPLLSLDERGIVEVGVADEHVDFVVHRRPFAYGLSSAIMASDC